MSLWKIAWRSIRQRPVTSLLTCVSMALGVALVVAVLTIYGVVAESFLRNRSLGYHLVVGGKNGSKLELVMSSVFHIGSPQLPVPYSYYQEFLPTTDAMGNRVERSMSANVALAVPICLGDTHGGYRVVATLPQIFDFEYARGKHYEMGEGRNFAAGREGWFEAVIGAEVARKLNLRVGDTFRPAHGEGELAEVHDDDFHIVGVLAPSGTPNDRALFVHMEGFYRMEGHGDPAPSGTKIADPRDRVIPDESKAVTAVFVLYGSEALRQAFGDSADGMASALAKTQHDLINKSPVAQAAQPLPYVSIVLERFVEPSMYVLLGLTILTVIVASIGIMVGIYNTMAGRRHEIAVMRALGAGRVTVMTIVLLESILLSLMGGAAGFLLGHAVVALANPVLVDYTGLSVGWFSLDWRTLSIVPALVALAAIVGYLPALAAYRTDVVKGLSATE